MRAIINFTILNFTIFFGFLGTARAEDRYLFITQFENPVSFGAYKTLVANIVKADPWLLDREKMLGPPNKLISLNNKPFEFAVACNKDECKANRILLLFSGDGSQVWGLARKHGIDTYLGNPEGAVRVALDAAKFNY